MALATGAHEDGIHVRRRVDGRCRAERHPRGVIGRDLDRGGLLLARGSDADVPALRPGGLQRERDRPGRVVG